MYSLLQLLSISATIYDTVWWEYSPKIGRSLLLIMQCSQKELHLTSAGGVFHINLDLCISVKFETIHFMLIMNFLCNVSILGDKNGLFNVYCSTDNETRQIIRRNSTIYKNILIEIFSRRNSEQQ